MIRQTLAATKAATFSVLMPGAGAGDFRSRTGTGFFVSADGLFVTARHVVLDPTIRATPDDFHGATLDKELGPGPPIGYSSAELVFEDAATDLAVLRVDFDKFSKREELQGRSGFPFIQVSRRLLGEGEPVYAFGYPLPSANVQELEGGVKLGTMTLRPRVTSAIISSAREEHGPVTTSRDPVTYVIDKALNFGNSGGPILATETGNAHAVCTRFQPVCIEQGHVLDSQGKPLTIFIPSLYGVVSSLANAAIQSFLESEGAPLADD